MRKWRRMLVIGLIAVCFVVSFGGCGVTEGIASGYHTIFGLGKNQMFRIKNEVCTRGEAEIFLVSQKSMYENAYGTTIWKVEIENGKDFEGYMLDSLKEFLARLKCMQLMARDRDITLTKEEHSLAQSAGKEYYSKLGKDTAGKMGVTEAQAVRAFEEYHLANKLADKLTEGENGVISDSEARVIHIQQIYIRTSSVDALGNQTKLSGEALSQKQQKAQEAFERAQSGSDFETLAKKYGEGMEVSMTVGRGELPEAVEEGAFALADNQVSNLIEAEDGFYIIKCIEDYDAAATQANKTKIAEQRKVDAFLTEYEEFSKNCPSELNEKAWNNLSYEGTETISVNFYEIYNYYFGN